MSKTVPELFDCPVCKHSLKPTENEHVYRCSACERRWHHAKVKYPGYYRHSLTEIKPYNSDDVFCIMVFKMEEFEK